MVDCELLLLGLWPLAATLVTTRLVPPPTVMFTLSCGLQMIYTVLFFLYFSYYRGVYSTICFYLQVVATTIHVCDSKTAIFSTFRLLDAHIAFPLSPAFIHARVHTLSSCEQHCLATVLHSPLSLPWAAVACCLSKIFDFPLGHRVADLSLFLADLQMQYFDHVFTFPDVLRIRIRVAEPISVGDI